jgi:Zn-finger nucleic acid-binding protein
MKCPHCPGSALVINERSNIEIDYCPQCRGVWLDRGELDKLVERSHHEYDPAPGNKGGEQPPAGKRRKSSWLGELFN